MIKETAKTKKAINFDLDTVIMQQLYGANYTYKYQKLGNDLHKLGFEHRQGSGYISVKELSERQVRNRIKKLSQQNPWLAICAKQFDVTNIGKQFSMLDVIKTTNTPTKPLVPTTAPALEEHERE